jgi:hypothetical protein
LVVSSTILNSRNNDRSRAIGINLEIYETHFVGVSHDDETETGHRYGAVMGCEGSTFHCGSSVCVCYECVRVISLMRYKLIGIDYE